MIKSVTELLSALVAKEEEVLARHRITHGPSIGKMYEGLTRKLVQSAVPRDPPLQVVTGFVEGNDGSRSDEQDIMIVVGDGERLPNTDIYIYPAEQVLTSIEVKNTLRKNDLIEAITNLDTLRGLLPKTSLNIGESVTDAFQKIVGRLAPNRSDLHKIPELYQHIWHNMVLRRAMPGRIVLGYRGYKTERGMRDGISEYINSIASTGGRFGPLYLPDAIINLHASIVFNAAAPWFTPVENEQWWPLLFSSSMPPIEVLLEVIWTRLLQRGFVTAHVFGEDLSIDVMHRFLDAKHVAGLKPGWEYRISPLAGRKKGLAALPSTVEWEPPSVSKDTFLLANILAHEVELDLSSLQWPKEVLEGAVTELERHGIIARDLLRSNVVGLVTDELVCIITNKGEFVVGDNVSGRVVRSLIKSGRLAGSIKGVDSMVLKNVGGAVVGEECVLPGDGIGWQHLLNKAIHGPNNSEGSKQKP